MNTNSAQLSNPFFINSNICLRKEDVFDINALFKSTAGNTGNSYITYSLMKALGVKKINHIQNIYEYDFANADKDISFINDNCSHAVLMLQDQIRISESYGLKLPHDKISSFIEKLKKPVVVSNIGANSFNGFDSNFYKALDSKLVRMLKVISHHTEVIGVRGAFTQEVLAQLGITNTQIVGCPTFFEMGRNRILEKKPFSKNIKVLATSHLPTQLDNILPTILQDEMESDIINRLAFGGPRTSKINDYHVKKLFANKFQCFSDIDSWRKYVAKFDFAIGSRVHGSIMSINSGTCALLFNSDSRATEMSEFLKVPHRPDLIGETNIEKLYQACDIEALNRAYPALFDNYISFLKKNSMPVGELEKIDSKENKKPYSISQPVLKRHLISLMNWQYIKYKTSKIMRNFYSEIEDTPTHKTKRILGIKIRLQKK